MLLSAVDHFLSRYLIFNMVLCRREGLFSSHKGLRVFTIILEDSSFVFLTFRSQINLKT